MRLMNDKRRGGYAANLSERWQQLRVDVLSKDSLMSRFTTTYNWLDSNGVYVREALAWKDYQFKSDEINHIGWWIEERLEFLDKYFIMDEDDIVVAIDENEIKNVAYIYDDEIVLLDDVNTIDIYSINGILIKSEQNIMSKSYKLDWLNQGVYIIKMNNTAIKFIKH